MLLHPPLLAREFIASYGEMSRRSGSAAKADNHSDISPLLTLGALPPDPLLALSRDSSARRLTPSPMPESSSEYKSDPVTKYVNLR